MCPVIDLATYRRTGKIVQRIPVVYDDARLEFARRVELGLYVIEQQPDEIDQLLAMAKTMRGEDATPSDSPLGAA